MGSDGSEPLEQRLAVLEARVAELEAVRAIEHVLVAYGFAVDAVDADGTASLYADDTVLVVDGREIARGTDAVRAMVLGPEHGAIAPGSAHVMGPFDVRVDGESAVAVGYATTFVRSSGSLQVWRQAVNRWELSCVDGRWRIRRRESVSLDDAGAAHLLRQGVPDPGPTGPA